MNKTELKRRAKELFDTGCPLKQISEDLNIPYKTIHRWAKYGSSKEEPWDPDVRAEKTSCKLKDASSRLLDWLVASVTTFCSLEQLGTIESTTKAADLLQKIMKLSAELEAPITIQESEETFSEPDDLTDISLFGEE